jgi:DNA primase
MAGRIPQTFIDDLLNRADIVDLIDARVHLKKAGKNYQACCPFHNEKSPSFTVSPEKQFYHCFGCGAHGNSISFLMEYDGLNFPDAVQELANQLGMEIPTDALPTPSTPQSANQYALMEQALRFFQQQLKTAPTAIDYLKKRGLTGEIAKEFSIGYAPAGWHGLRQLLAKNKELEGQLIELGMLIRNEDGKSYDRFRDRVMFPIRDRMGRVIGFGGRVLGDGTPKYLNSPETPIFHKGKELFGLYQVKQRYRTPARILIVEGYMDVVALAQFGVDYAVASLGTSTTTDHMRLLFRTTPEVICCYDGDNAGREAAWRALENALPGLQDGKNLRFIFLPSEHDPDTYIRAEGKEAFEQLLDHAESYADFMFDRLTRDLNLSGEAGQNELANKAVALIRQVPEGFNRESLITKLSTHLHWGENEKRLRDLFRRQELEQAQTAQPLKKEKKIKLTLIRRAIALVVQHPEQAALLPPLPDVLKSLSEPGIEILLALLDQLHDRPMTTGQLLEHWRDTPAGAGLAKLAVLEEVAIGNNIQEELEDVCDRLLDLYLQQRMNVLQNRVAMTPEEKQELLYLLAEYKRFPK